VCASFGECVRSLGNPCFSWDFGYHFLGSWSVILAISAFLGILGASFGEVGWFDFN
jgi:hypothetical protein